jgi:hypothetical protein
MTILGWTLIVIGYLYDAIVYTEKKAGRHIGVWERCGPNAIIITGAGCLYLAYHPGMPVARPSWQGAASMTTLTIALYVFFGIGWVYQEWAKARGRRVSLEAKWGLIGVALAAFACLMLS